MNDITACFAFLKYCLGYKGNMSRVIAGMNWGMISDCSICITISLMRGLE